MRKLENDMDNLKIETVNKSISKTIMEARQKLNLKQKRFSYENKCTTSSYSTI